MSEQCGEHYASHPTRPHLCAVCTRTQGHDGQHDNTLATRSGPDAGATQKGDDRG